MNQGQGQSQRPVLEVRLQQRDKGLTLVEFFKKRFNHVSHTAIRMIIRLDGVWLNNILIRNPGHVLRGEEELVLVESSLPLQSQRRKGHDEQPRGSQNSPFREWIIFEDNHIVAINKPAGFNAQSQGSGGRPPGKDDVLVLARNFYQRKNDKRKVNLSLVHRIDRNISGILIFSKTPEAARKLTHIFRTHAARKQYVAFVKGVPTQNTATLTHFIAKNPKENRATVKDSDGGGEFRKAVLKYQVKNKYQTSSVIKVDMETDHSHQIRAQLAYIGHPILGDLKYGGGDPNDSLGNLLPQNRMALHASRMVLPHPASEKMLTLEANFPQDLKVLMNQLAHVDSEEDATS